MICPLTISSNFYNFSIKWCKKRHSQAVRQRSAKPLSPGRNPRRSATEGGLPGGASKKETNLHDWSLFLCASNELDNYFRVKAPKL